MDHPADEPSLALIYSMRLIIQRTTNQLTRIIDYMSIGAGTVCVLIGVRGFSALIRSRETTLAYPGLLILLLVVALATVVCTRLLVGDMVTENRIEYAMASLSLGLCLLVAASLAAAIAQLPAVGWTTCCFVAICLATLASAFIVRSIVRKKPNRDRRLRHRWPSNL